MPLRPLSVPRAAALALCLAAMSPWSPAQPPSQPPAQRREAAKPAPALGDEALQRAIARRFAASKIGQNGFAVTVRGGVATLTGTAQVPQHKGVATRLAKAAGAREVVNQIEISPASKPRSQARSLAPPSPHPPARPHSSTTPHQTPKAAPPPGSVPSPSSRNEPEPMLQTTASNEVSPAKKFRLLSGPSSGTPPGSARQARVRRY